MIRRDPKFSSDSERQPLLRQQTEEEEDKGLTAFLLKFGEGLEETTDSRLWISALTIGASYFFAGLIPLVRHDWLRSSVLRADIATFSCPTSFSKRLALDWCTRS